MADLRFNKTLIIGGTGMLAETSRFLAEHSSHLTIVARQPDALAKSLGATSAVLDWSAEQGASSVISILPEFDLVVSWVHDDGIWLLKHLEGKVKTGGRSIRVHDSKSGDPATMVTQNPDPRSDITRQNVILGWIDTSTGRRWLRDGEISAGVINAVTNESTPLVIVGTADD